MIVFVSIVTAPFIGECATEEGGAGVEGDRLGGDDRPGEIGRRPNVARDSTCQNTLQAWAPFSKATGSTRRS